jgi:hypothetical protein
LPSPITGNVGDVPFRYCSSGFGGRDAVDTSSFVATSSVHRYTPPTDADSV